MEITMTWRPLRAVSFARLHALPKTSGYCGRFVSNAIRAGGVDLPNTHHARDMGRTLEHAGFYAVRGDLKEGDVAVIQSLGIPGHTEGHVCIYDAAHRQWISDYRQTHGSGEDGMYSGPEYRKRRPDDKIYRHD